MYCYFIFTGEINAQERQKIIFSLLSAHYNLQVNSLNFKRGAYGKPYIHTPGGNIGSFNYTHTKRYLALLADAARAVGVDAEEISKPRHGLHLLNDIYSPEEHRFIKGLDLEERKEEALKIWVQKEAIGKALGTGICYDMASITVSGATPGLVRSVALHDQSICVGLIRMKECYVGIAWIKGNTTTCIIL